MQTRTRVMNEFGYWLFIYFVVVQILIHHFHSYSPLNSSLIFYEHPLPSFIIVFPLEIPYLYNFSLCVDLFAFLASPSSIANWYVASFLVSSYSIRSSEYRGSYSSVSTVKYFLLMFVHSIVLSVLIFIKHRQSHHFPALFSEI